MQEAIPQLWHRSLLTVDRWRHRCHRAFVGISRSRSELSLQLDRLEKRILFSASPIDPNLLDLDSADSEPLTTSHSELDRFPVAVQIENAERPVSARESTSQKSTSQSRELVIIDSNVDGIDALLDELASANRDYYVIDSTHNGIDQITDYLSSRRDIESLHLFSHGKEGSLQLGNTILDSESINRYAWQIGQWHSAFAADADILFYGCNFAGDMDGQQLLESIAGLTDTDVAASTDFTGHASLGGDWDLEFEIGSVETAIAASTLWQSGWAELLAANKNPPTDIQPDNLTIAEHTDTTGGISLGTLIATDPDAGDTFTWSIEEGDDSAVFYLSGLSGDELFLTDGVIDFERQSEYRVTVTVSDAKDREYSEQLTVSVLDQNDAPSLLSSQLGAVAKDDVNPGGASVASLFDAAFSDPDQDASLSGLVIVGNTADAATEGSWQFSSDSGGSWAAVGAVDDSGSGLVISRDSILRFVPVTGYTGTPNALQVRALDNSYAGDFSISTGAMLATRLDTSDPGGQASFSDPVASLATDVLLSAATMVQGTDDMQSVLDTQTIAPFTGVTIFDAEGDQVEITVVLSGDDANGRFSEDSLTASGFVKTGPGTYKLSRRSVADAQSAIGQLVFSPTENQVSAGQTIATTMTIVADDGTSSSFNSGTTVRAASVNFAPTLDDTSILIAPRELLIRDAEFFEELTADLDGDPLTAVLVKAPAEGSFTLLADGSFTYQPRPGFTGIDSFQWKATDQTAESQIRTVEIRVRRVTGNNTQNNQTTKNSNGSGSTKASKGELKPEQVKNNKQANSPRLETTETNGDPAIAIATGSPIHLSSLGSDRFSKWSDGTQMTSGPRTDRESGIPSLHADATGFGSDSVTLGNADSGSQSTHSLQGQSPVDLPVDLTGGGIERADLNLLISEGVLWTQMDEEMERVQSFVHNDIVVVGAAGAAASSITIGYVAWAIRSGFLLSGVLAQIPAWQAIDPLTIMHNLASSRNETLEEMMERKARKARKATRMTISKSQQPLKADRTHGDLG